MIDTTGMPEGMVSGIGVILTRLKYYKEDINFDIDSSIEKLSVTQSDEEFISSVSFLNEKAKAGALIALQLVKSKNSGNKLIEDSFDLVAAQTQEEGCDLYNKHINYMHDPIAWPLDDWDGAV